MSEDIIAENVIHGLFLTYKSVMENLPQALNIFMWEPLT